MDKLKLDIQKFALDPPMAGNIIDEVCLHRYHQNIKRDYAKKGSDNNFANLVVDSIRSKNMLNLENWRTQTINGITFTNNGNGSITINGTATQDFGVNFVLFKIKAGNYYLSINESSTLPNVFYLYDHDGNVGFGNGTITLSQDYNKMGFDTWITNGTSFNNITISPQLETGSTGTTFAPYQNLDLKIATGSATVNSTYISNAENNSWERTGKVVVYHFTLTVTGTWDYTTNFLTNLPKPISYTRFMALDTSNNEPIRVGIDTNGSAYNAWSAVTPSSGHIIEGLVTYITSE